MAVENLNEKLAQIISEEPSKWLEEVEFRQKNRKWLRRSQAIALKLLIRLDELEMSQKELAQKMGISAQLVNKWVKGKENLTLETIARLEEALGIELMVVTGKESQNEASQFIELQEYNLPNDYSAESQPVYRTCKMAPFQEIILNKAR